MMLTAMLSETLGLAAEALTDEDDVVIIDSPVCFEDGDPVPVFAQQAGPKLRFFDDGCVLLHLEGRGVPIGDEPKPQFIAALVEPHGVSLTDVGELEIWAGPDNLLAAFAGYMAAMDALICWEKENVGRRTQSHSAAASLQ